MLEFCFEVDGEQLELAATQAARRLHGEQALAVRDQDRSPGHWFKVIIEGTEAPVLTDTRLRLEPA